MARSTAFSRFPRWPKPFAICSSLRPVLRAYQDAPYPWPPSILFGHAGSSYRDGSGHGVAVIPRHPDRRLLGHMAGVLLQGDPIAERGNAVQLASVDQAHEQVADLGAVLRSEKECIFPVQNRLFERPLDQRVIQRSPRLTKKQRQRMP